MIWERVISLLVLGKLDPTPIVGRVEPLTGWRACFEEIGEGKIVKAYLKTE